MKITLDTIDKVYQAGRADVETMELKGYELVKNLFVDSSGFGAPDEPALDQNQFKTEVEALLKEHGALTAKITDVGQFQVYLGLFKKTGKSISKRIANNTLLISYPDGRRAIRLHNTDILTEKNGRVVFDTGGYSTRTTHNRMSRYAPAGVYAFSRNFETYISNNGRELAYKPGLSIKGALNV